MLKRILLGSALVFGATGVFADDSSDLAAMKESLQRMQAEMAKRDAQYNAVSDELQKLRSSDRLNAGGEPAKLQSANGKATITIGGQTRVRYETGWDSAPDQPKLRRQKAGWAIQRLELNFNIQLSADTKALISLRPSSGTQGGNFNFGGANTNIINQAYWDWSNIGGSGLGLRVGYQYIPFGGYTGEDGAWSWDGTVSGTNFYPFVASRTLSNALSANPLNPINNINPTGDAVDGTPTEIGAVARYKFLDDQVVVKAGIFGASNGNPLGASYSNSTQDSPRNEENSIRNIGLVNHVINIAYNPCWIEGLHLEAAYWGRFDNYASNDYGKDHWGEGVNDHLYRYSPEFNAQVYYKTGAWKFVAEWEGVVNPRTTAEFTSNGNTVPANFFVSGFGQAISLGTYYNVTDKWVLSGGADFARVGRSFGINGYDYNHSVNAFQLAVGTGYTFSNGITAQLGYRHLWQWATGDGSPDGSLNTDTITFQTAYKF